MATFVVSGLNTINLDHVYQIKVSERDENGLPKTLDVWFAVGLGHGAVEWTQFTGVDAFRIWEAIEQQARRIEVREEA